MTNESSVTVLGLGTMGYALAQRFLSSGARTTVWNRTMAKAEPLVRAGATGTADVGEAVRSSAVIVICLLDDTTVRNILQPIRESLSGRTVINLTSQTPHQARESADWFAEAGARYLSGGIMATPDLIGTPHSLILYSGNESVLAEHRELLETLGNAEFVDGDPGSAALYDIALLSGMYGMFAGVLHAMTLMTTSGRTASSVVPHLQQFVSAMAQSIPGHADRIDNADYARDVGSPLDMQANGFPHFLQTAIDQGVRTDLLDGLHTLMREAVRAGHGKHDMAAVHEVMRSER